MTMQYLNKRMDDWWQDRFETGDVDVKREADRGIADFAADPEFCRLFTEVYMRTVLYNRGIQLASRIRSLIRAEGRAIARARPLLPLSAKAASPPPPTADPSSPPAPLPAVVATPPHPPDPSPALSRTVKSFREWMDHDPDTHHHVSILTFTKPKLLKLSRRYYQKGGADIVKGAEYAVMAGRLPDDQTELGAIATDADLNALIGNLEVGLSAKVGLPGIGSFTWEASLS